MMWSRNIGLGALMSVMLSSCLGIFNAQKRQMQEVHEQHFEVMIIPATSHDDEMESDYFKSRLVWAVEAYKHNKTDYLLFTGGTQNTVYVTAKVMKMCAIEMGVSPNHVLIETQGNNLTEKLYLSLKMCKDLGFESVAFSSDAYQSRQAHRILKSKGLALPFYPIDLAVTNDHEVDLTISLNDALEIHPPFDLPKNEMDWAALSK